LDWILANVQYRQIDGIPEVDHEYKIEHDARCLGNPQHELKSGTKLKFDSFGYSHCPICNSQVKYTW